MKVLHKIVFPSLLLLSCTSAFTQISNESVDIIKDFEVSLLESFKLDVSPQLPTLDTTTKEQNYLVPSHPLNISYDPPKLRPIGMKTVKPPEPFRGFAKLGAGMPSQFWGEAGYYFGDPETFDGTVWFRHHSANNDNNQPNQRFSNNDIKGDVTAYLDNGMAIGFNAGYSFDRLHYYGYDTGEFSFNESAVRQRYNMLDLGVDFFNTEPNPSDLNYWFKPRYYNLKDNFSNTENGFVMDAGATKWFSEKHPLTVNIRAEYARFKDTLTQNLNNLGIQPSFAFHGDIFMVKAGMNLVSSSDGLKLFPDIEGNLRIIGNGIQIFAGARGDLRQNNMRSLTEYSPWLDIRGDTIRNTQYTDFFGGIKGDLGFLEYSVRVNFTSAENLALFQTRFTLDNARVARTQFNTTYDDGTIYAIRGSAQLVPFRDFTVTGSFSQNIYDMSNEAKAWGLPSTEGNFGLVYTLFDQQLALKSNLYIADDIPFLDQNGNETTTNALFDLNVGAHYYFIENIGAFVEFNNILNNKRERWLNYPMFGTNFIAGVQARF